MDTYKTRNELETELTEMRQHFLELQQCHIDVQSAMKKYDELLHSAPDAMVFVDREARIVLVNAQFGSLFGYREEELVGMDLAILIPEQYRIRHRDNVARYFEHPLVRLMGSDLTIYGLKKDGTVFPADISLSPLTTEDGIVAVGAVRDLTERKKNEAERQRMREQLAEAEKLSALGRIAANVADEIRNPLTALGGFARRLQRIADSEKEREYAKYIVDEVARLEGLLRDVLVFSRSRSAILGDYDIHVILDEALKACEERCRRQAVVVLKEYGEGAVVRVDRTHILEALECLTENSLDAMPDGGTLTIATDREKAGGVSYIRAILQDTGEGIPPEKAGVVFEPFFTTKISPKGTGLGLPIAKRLVEEAGGRIMIASVPDRGTAVTLLFPDTREAY